MIWNKLSTTQNTKRSAVWNLEVKMVDGCKCTQAIVTQPEVGVSGFCSHVERKQEAILVNPLRQAFKNPRDQQDMSILNRTNLYIYTQQKLTVRYYKFHQNAFMKYFEQDKPKKQRRTLIATTLGEFSTSIGAFGKNWTSFSMLGLNWKRISSCPTLVKLNLFSSKAAKSYQPDTLLAPSWCACLHSVVQ